MRKRVEYREGFEVAKPAAVHGRTSEVTKAVVALLLLLIVLLLFGCSFDAGTFKLWAVVAIIVLPLAFAAERVARDKEKGGE